MWTFMALPRMTGMGRQLPAYSSLLGAPGIPGDGAYECLEASSPSTTPLERGVLRVPESD